MQFLTVPSMPANVSAHPEYDTKSDLSLVFVSWNEVVSTIIFFKKIVYDFFSCLEMNIAFIRLTIL